MEHIISVTVENKFGVFVTSYRIVQRAWVQYRESVGRSDARSIHVSDDDRDLG